jgi:hypothetical protein
LRTDPNNTTSHKGKTMKNKKGRRPTKKGFPVWGWIVLAVVLLAVAGFVVVQKPKPAVVSLPPEITVDQTTQKRDQGAFILDVREPSVF